MNPPIIPLPAARLLHSFGFLGLGEGNPSVSMNLLTSMCATLAAIAGPDACLMSEAGDRFGIGISWLLTGPKSQELHRQIVLAPLRDYQSALSYPKPLARVKVPATKRGKKKRTGSETHSDTPRSPITPELLAKARSRLIADSLLSDHELDHRSTSLFHDGSNPKLLWDELRHSHLGHPLVEVVMRHGRDDDAIQNSCLAIMDGQVHPTAFPRKFVRGFVAATLPQAELEFVARFSHSTHWLRRMLWLDDTSSNDCDAKLPSIIALDDTRDRFVKALRLIIESRLANGVTPHSVPEGFHRHLKMTRDHIWELEDRMPRISVSLENLFATLYFGLSKMVRIVPRAPEFRWTFPGIVSLANHLAYRMAATYTTHYRS